jgi:hypothetical protein
MQQFTQSSLTLGDGRIVDQWLEEDLRRGEMSAGVALHVADSRLKTTVAYTLSL